LHFNKSFGQENINKRLATTATLNVLVSGTIAGIGAVINKKPGERTLPVFLKGFGFGGVGGGICYIGKSMLWQTAKRENFNYVWPGRIINSIGASIIENAASNKLFYDSFGMNLWIFRLDINSNKKIKFRICPASTISSIYLWSVYGNIDLKKTIYTGSIMLVGREKKKNNLYYFDSQSTKSAGGMSLFNAIIINKTFYEHFYQKSIYSTIAHELVHTFQNRQSLSFNKYYNKIDYNLKASSKSYKKLSKYYFLDVNGIDIASAFIFNITLYHSDIPIEKEAYLLGEHRIE